jgi:hypothetical protein
MNVRGGLVMAAAAALAMLVLADAAIAEVQTVVPTDADAGVLWGYGGTGLARSYNYGGATTLGVGNPYYGDNYYKNYLHFDLSGLDPTKPVSSASLRLDWVSGTTARPDRNVEFFAIVDETNDWDPTTLLEGTGTGQDLGTTYINWLNAPQSWESTNNHTSDFIGEGTADSSPTRKIGDVAASGGLSVDLDITELIRWALGQASTFTSDFSETDDELTIAFICQYGSGYPIPDWRWRSRESTVGDTSDDPRIAVTQTPEPATAGLLALGSLGLAALRRRRK